MAWWNLIRSENAKMIILPRKYSQTNRLENLSTKINRKIFNYSDGETLTHLLKASLGTGILAMPVAFMYSGIVVGIFATIITAFICTHCSYILGITKIHFTLFEFDFTKSLSIFQLNVHTHCTGERIEPQ